MSRPVAALVLALLAVACRGDAPGDPPRAALGRDSCARCGMAVTEARYAGGWVSADGTAVVYDDPGELLAALRSEPSHAAAAWIGDYETGAWVRVRDAFFVRAEGLATPMGTGVVAFAERGRAEAFLSSRAGAVPVDWPAVGAAKAGGAR